MLGAVALLTGCVTGSGDDDTSDTPRRDLAATPESLAPAPDPAATPTGSASPGSSVAPGSPATTAGSAPASPGATAGGTRPTAGPSASARPYRVAGSVTDRSRDAGSATPGYGDVTSITIEDDGVNARVTVRFSADVPARLPADETMGVGVDFYANVLQNESDYQLFADGQPEGWYAYLHTPRGFVRYRGTFGIGGNRLVFTVPWSELGSPARGSFGGFADWTRTATPSNLAGEDFVPDIGKASYAR